MSKQARQAEVEDHPCGCINQEIRSKKAPLKRKGFSAAKVRCKIIPMKYGYARVSTDGQSVDAQVRQLTKAGCKKVFREVASGAKTDRAQLRRCSTIEAGDVLMVTRLDRLARSTLTFSTPSSRSPIAKPVSDRSATHGPTPPHHTGG